MLSRSNGGTTTNFVPSAFHSFLSQFVVVPSRLLPLTPLPDYTLLMSDDGDRNAKIKALEEELARLKAQAEADKAAGSGGAIAGQTAVGVGGDVHGNITITQVTPPSGPSPLPLPAALQRYLDNLINTHQHLRLQAIRTDQPLSVKLEKVYVSLTAVDKRGGPSGVGAGLAPAQRGQPQGGQPQGLPLRDEPGGYYELSIPAALNRYQRLVIIGDPGSGKTTLLAYLALTYARTKHYDEDLVEKRLKLNEAGRLPILLPLRDFGRHLKDAHPDPGKDGPALLLNYLREHYANQDIRLPEDFFAAPLEKGEAVVLLDGMDEVASAELRGRVARLIEKFAVRYPENRFVVTSREVGYEGAARVGAGFGLAKVREFTPVEVRQFIRDWTKVVEVALADEETPEALRAAGTEADKLIHAIESNARIADLAVNPLLLTVIALVHRYRAALPERRSELYEEAVEVLLAGWDKAKGLETETQLAGRKLDAGDRRELLTPIAFWLHERNLREIELDDLRPLLTPSFAALAGNDAQLARKAVDDFLDVINERSGLLIERGAGIYSFAHLTFQEYLAARALADRADAVAYTLKKLADPWWREVILLEAGYLGTQGKRRASELIRAIANADPKTEPEPHHHLLLAAECLFDVGAIKVEGDLLGEVRRKLQKEADAPIQKGKRESVLRKVAATNALSRIESGQFISKFWKPPWGEPEWITIPAGEFWMGGEGEYDGKPVHRAFVSEFQIARVPITNAQYALFVADAKVEPPEDWRGGKPPQGKENHPVVNVSWHDARAYCKWLSEKIGRAVRPPTEAEWEKAARGSQDGRVYPWGDEWLELRCNSDELGLGDTSPVGLFLNGASPYGVLDMVGNVWEWCQSKYKPYPYRAEDGREELTGGGTRVLRGASFYYNRGFARCACRNNDHPDFRYYFIGFRVVVFPGSRS